MKILLTSCREVSFTDAEPSDMFTGERQQVKKTKVNRQANGEEVTRRNVACAFVCVQPFDKEEYIGEAVDIVLGYYHIMRKRLKKSGRLELEQIMIIPFVHLSAESARPEIAKRFCDRIARGIEDKKYKVTLGTFGFHKDFKWHIPPERGSVAYRSIPFTPDLELRLLNLVELIGKSRAREIIDSVKD